MIDDQLRRRLGATFTTGGAAYDRLRPGYPASAVDWLTDGVAPGAAVADVGAGTGKLTVDLLARGYDVVAVDPSADMLAQLHQRAPGLRTQQGTGEDTGLASGSLALATFAQSWHWVDAPVGAAELARVLVPGGRVAMLWNFMDVRVDWVRELADLWHTLATREAIEANRHRPELGDAFGPVESVTVDWVQPMTPADLAALVTTRSYYLAASADEQTQIRARVADLIDGRFAGVASVDLPYRTHGYRAAKS